MLSSYAPVINDWLHYSSATKPRLLTPIWFAHAVGGQVHDSLAHSRLAGCGRQQRQGRCVMIEPLPRILALVDHGALDLCGRWGT